MTLARTLARPVWSNRAAEVARFVMIVALVMSGAAERLWMWFERFGASHDVRRHILVPAYLLLIFLVLAGASLLRFRLGRESHASQVAGLMEHAAMFLVGGCLLVMCQVLVRSEWLIAYAVVLLPLFLLVRRFSSTVTNEVTSDGVTIARLIAWAWAMLGLAISTRVIPSRTFATPPYVVWAMVTMTLWSWVGVAIGGSWSGAAREAKGAGRWLPMVGADRI